MSELPASRLARTSSIAANSGLPVARMSASRPSLSTPLAPSLQTSSRSPGSEVDDEEVGLAVADRVDGAEDEVAVRVDPRLLLGDPALVDEGLHEGVVEGQLADRAVAEEVAAAVTDVADAEPATVEDRHGRGGAGAVERRVVVDQLDQPVVGPVDRAGDPRQQVLGRVAGRRGVEAPELGDRRARGDVAAGGPADAVADGEQPGAGVPGVLVVLAHPADVGDGGVVQTQRRRGRGCRLRCVGHTVGYFLSSRIVLPMRTWVPMVIVVGWLIRTEPT